MHVNEIITTDWPSDPEPAYQGYVKLRLNYRKQLAVLLLMLGARRIGAGEKEDWIDSDIRDIDDSSVLLYLSYSEKDPYITNMTRIRKYLDYKGYDYGHSNT